MSRPYYKNSSWCIAFDAGYEMEFESCGAAWRYYDSHC